MPDYDEILKKSELNVTALSKKLKELDRLYETIETILDSPKEFDVKLKEITKFSEDYTSLISDVTEKYINVSNALFIERLQELQLKIDKLKFELDRLEKTDFDVLFQNLQNSFIEKTRKDLEVELAKIDAKSVNLQQKIDELSTQIERIEKIDLEKHFDKLQKTLSDIFGAINSIYIPLTSLTQQIVGITQSLSNIQTTIDSNHVTAKENLKLFSESISERLLVQDAIAKKNAESIESNHAETKETLKKINESISEKLLAQDANAKKNAEILEERMANLLENNNELKKEIRTNRIIQIVGISIILLLVLYLAVGKGKG